jgi:hypothetical protein
VQSPGIRVTSKFGTRIHPVTKVRTTHAGIDLTGNPNNRNETILCIADGTVVAVRQQGAQWGPMCWIRIRHENDLSSVYMHQQNNTIRQKIGDKVKAGDPLGIIGTTGQSTGVHLHFQIDRGSNASAIDPWDYLFNGKQLFPAKRVIAFPIDRNHIEWFINIGIINSPEYWLERKDIQWLPELFAKTVSMSHILASTKDRGITDLDQALNILQQVKLINTPNYWKVQSTEGPSKWLGPLLINMANKVIGPI